MVFQSGDLLGNSGKKGNRSDRISHTKPDAVAVKKPSSSALLIHIMSIEQMARIEDR